MIEKLDPIDVIKCFISEESIEEGNPIYIIEKEFMQWIILHAEFFLERYAQGKGKHWTKKERENTRIGLCGQKAFELMLQLMEVPYVPNDPIIDQRLQKDYDFKIPTLGKIEVKTFKHYCKKVLVKVSEWHGDQYLIAWKMRELPNEEFGSLRMIGWLTKEEVEATPTTPKGATKFNPYSDAKIIDMSELRQPKAFITKLLKAKTSKNQ